LSDDQYVLLCTAHVQHAYVILPHVNRTLTSLYDKLNYV